MIQYTFLTVLIHPHVCVLIIFIPPLSGAAAVFLFPLSLSSNTGTKHVNIKHIKSVSRLNTVAPVLKQHEADVTSTQSEITNNRADELGVPATLETLLLLFS